MNVSAILEKEEFNLHAIYLYANDRKWYVFEQSAYYLSIIANRHIYPVFTYEKIIYAIIDESTIKWLYKNFSIEQRLSRYCDTTLYMDFIAFFPKFHEWKTKKTDYMFNCK